MSKCEHGIKLNGTCLSCVQIERSAMVAATEPEPKPDVLERRLKATYETLVKAGFPHSAKAMADAIAEITQLEKVNRGLRKDTEKDLKCCRDLLIALEGDTEE